MGLIHGPPTSASVAATKINGTFGLTTGGVTGVAATATTLVLNAADSGNSAEFTLLSSEITVAHTGRFLITADCHFNTGGSSRSEFSKWLEVDSGSGFTEVPFTRFATYQRGYDSGTSGSMTRHLDVTTGDVFRLRVQRTDGGATTGYQDNNGTRLIFTEVDGS